MRFNLDQLFEEESLEDELLVTQKKIKVQEEEEFNMVQEGLKNKMRSF